MAGPAVRITSLEPLRIPLTLPAPPPPTLTTPVRQQSIVKAKERAAKRFETEQTRISRKKEKTQPQPMVKSAHDSIGRNDPCWCGSGKKYKRCHGA